MTIDLTINALLALAMACGTFAYIIRIGTHKSSPADAMAAAWNAWERVSIKALDKGQATPPPPAPK